MIHRTMKNCGIYSLPMVVQIVIDKNLLQAVDQAAQRAGSNRSAVVRDALREYLRRLEIRDHEERDRRGYSRGRQSRDPLAWEMEAAWPPCRTR
jgi:Arc/MetJ-type ribon-helix-helix transcriptional regulator